MAREVQPHELGSFQEYTWQAEMIRRLILGRPMGHGSAFANVCFALHEQGLVSLEGSYLLALTDMPGWVELTV